MLRLARLYRALLPAARSQMLVYRAQFVLWLLSGVFPLVMLAVWLAIVDEAGPLLGWQREDFIAYYVGAAVVHQLTFSWVNWQWQDEIRTGALSTRLIKPADPAHHFISEQLSWRIFFLMLVVPAVAVAAWLSPALTFDLTPARAVGVALSVILGFALSFAMASAFGVIAFWSTQSNNLYHLWYGMGQFLSGWIAPLAMFPTALRQAARWLPFRSMLGFPTELLTGQLTAAETVAGFAVTLLWLAIFGVLYRVLWRRGLKRYEAVGA